jgi:hypothetical protein
MTFPWTNRAGRKWVVAWLLPVLCLRALIPVGFMPAAHAGLGAALQLCDGHESHIVGGHHHGDPTPDGHGDHHDAPCAFSASAASAPPPTLLFTSHAVLESIRATECAESVSTALTVLPRAQSPRGPPSPV